MTNATIPANPTRPLFNSSTKLYVIVLAALGAVGGVLHGISEILQGNRPPTDIALRIGAFTVIPNYLITGICAVVVGTCILVWTLARIDRRWGPTLYLSLSVVLTLVGGGVAMIPGSILAWAVSTRIRQPLSWWNNTLSVQAKRSLSKLWPMAFSIGFGLFVVGFGIWSLVLPPGEIRQPTAMHYICWSLLSSGALVLILTVICGFARDLEIASRQDNNQSEA